MNRYGTIGLIGIFVAIAVLSFGTASAATNLGLEGWGLRAGLSIDPDQVIVGGHLDLGRFADSIHFMPNLTAGFGDDFTIVAISPDVLYTFPVEDIGHLYAGGVLTLQWIDFNDDTDTELGLHGLAGLMFDSAPVVIELNVGIDDAPDLKASIGYTFKAD